jgi:hypothetical protein
MRKNYTRVGLALMLAGTLGLFGVVAAAADPPTGGPPGQGECEHGNSGQTCVPDPNENGQDCEEHGNEGGVNEHHCISSPPPTPTEPPPTDPPPCDQDECPPTTTEPPPTPTEPPTTTVPPPPPAACEPSVTFSRWYGDPQIDITLEGPGRWKVKGGVQRAQHSDTGVDTKVFRVTLACDQTLVIDHYKVHRGAFLFVYLNGVLHDRILPPVLNR